MGHIHAAAMAEYAKDAAETAMPWERWEFISLHNQEYETLDNHPLWHEKNKYRRKPKIILINGHEVPEPHRKPLEIDDPYWTFTFFFDSVSEHYWSNDLDDNNALKNGFIHLTKEAAEKHFNALKSFTAKGDKQPHGWREGCETCLRRTAPQPPAAAPAQEGWCDGCSPDNCCGCGPGAAQAR